MTNAILKYRRPHADGYGPEVVDVVCAACSETRTVAYSGWSTIVCGGCGQELHRPDQGLPAVSDGDALSIKVRVIRDGMKGDHDAMTEPNSGVDDVYATRLNMWIRLLSDAIEKYDENQPKPY